MLFLLILFLVFTALDFYTTYIGLTEKNAREANPIVAAAIKKIGLVPTLILYKFIGGALGIVLYMIGYSLPLIIATVAYGIVVVNNFHVINKSK